MTTRAARHGLRGPALVGLLATALLAGCASGGTRTPDWRSDLRSQIAQLGVSTQTPIPFEIGPRERRWVEAEKLTNGTPKLRLQKLLARMTSEEGLGIEYQRGFTGTASEVFQRRTANCLGFMNLFIGLARHIGLPVYFVTVRDTVTYDRQDDLVVVIDHIAAGFGSDRDRLLLDFYIGEDEPNYQSLAKVSDRLAMAKYYANRGAEMLLEDRLSDAQRTLGLAVQIAPDEPTAWVNLGVAKRRRQDLNGAEEAYRRALEVDPEALSAYQNWAALLRVQGDRDAALELLELTHRLGSRNPYNYLSLGDWSLAAGRLSEARRFYRRALVLIDEKAEPYAALGQWALAAERRSLAKRWLKRARSIDPENPRVVRLASGIESGPSR